MPTLLQEDKAPFNLAYLVLKCAGLMNQEGRPWSLIFTMFQVSSCICLSFCSGVDVMWPNDDLPELIGALSTFAISIHISNKMINILSNETEIRQLISRLEKIRQEILQDNDRKHFILLADNLSRKIVMFVCTFLATCTIFSTVSNIFIDIITGSEKPHLAFQMWIPWRVTDIWTYLATIAFSIALTFPPTSIYMASSSLYYIFTLEISSYLQCLQSRLETMKLNDKGVYRQHTEIIELLGVYNKLFSGQIYLEIFLSSIQPCGFGYTLIKAFKKNDFRTMDLSFKFTVAIVTPFILCACGQEISTQLEKLHHSAYMCKWYEEKLESRRNLVQVMTATLKPPAPGFRQMIFFNYVTFTSVAQGIYSYLMMVNEFGEDD